MTSEEKKALAEIIVNSVLQTLNEQKSNKNKAAFIEIKCPVCDKPYKKCTCENNCGQLSIEGTVLKRSWVSKPKIIIPNGITKIDDRALACESRLKTVALPKSVVEIGKGAFEDCVNLEHINLHELINLTGIAENAFSHCEKMKLNSRNLTDLKKLKEIGTCAFWKSGIEEIVLKNVEKVGYGAFADCKNLESAYFGANEVEFKEWVFQGCDKLEYVDMPTETTEIPNNMFADCTSLVEIASTNNVKKIGKFAFSGCEQLWKIFLPNVQFIDEYGFSGCKDLSKDFMMELYTFETLEHIGCGAFADCIGFDCFWFPNSLKHIGESAFIGCEYLNYFYIPKSVVEIEKNAFPSPSFHSIKFETEHKTQPMGWSADLFSEYGTNVIWGFNEL